jgi:hypothetical protein
MRRATSARSSLARTGSGTFVIDGIGGRARRCALPLVFYVEASTEQRSTWVPASRWKPVSSTTTRPVV